MLLGNGLLPMFSVASGGGLTGATWALDGSGRAYNTPTLGSELLTNGGFESSFSSGLGSGWFKTSTPTTTQETTLVRSGANSQKVVAAPFNYDRVDGVGNYAATAAGQWIRSQTFVWVQAGVVLVIFANSGSGGGSATAAAWTHVFATGRSTGVPAGHYIRQDGATTATFYIDDSSNLIIATPALFATVASTSAAQTAAARIHTLTTGTQAGVGALIDSASNPQNFLIGYHNGTNVLLDKCVGGTYTNLITTAVSFNSLAQIEIRRPSGNTFQLWYNGAQRGTNQTVSDASIISNTIYGLFSTFSGNLFSEFTLGGANIRLGFS